MTFTEALHAFIHEVHNTPFLEWTAIFFAVAEVLLARSNNVLLYPAGIISTAIYTYIFIQPSAGLYADATLNVYYFVMSIYGWLLWTRNKNGHHGIDVSYSNKKDWTVALTIALGGWLVLYLLLTRFFTWSIPLVFHVHYTPSNVALWDAFISATAWSGMWLLAKRKIENWLLLNVSNIVAIPIYIYKGMPFTACLTLFLFIVAIFGYLDWKKIYREAHTKTAHSVA